jgi:hypothetical protein
MRNTKLAAAVAAVLASGAASAAGTVDVYISGASAQKNFWYADLANIAGCATSSIVGAKWGGPATSPFPAGPDFSFVQCTAGTTALGGITSGTVVTFHYSAELGSVWGLANALGNYPTAGYPNTHIFLAPAADCVPGAYVAANAFIATKCGSSSSGQYAVYTKSVTGSGTDIIVGGNPDYIVTKTPDIDVMDLEPAQFGFTDNWPTANLGGSPAPLYSALGPVPNATNIGNVSSVGGAMNGEVFAIIVNDGGTYNNTTGTSTGGLFTDPTNLSSASISAIFQGNYTKWAQLPEIGSAAGSNAITICRRDHGSGSQISASIFFVGNECGVNTNTFVEETAANVAPVIVNNTTTSMRQCVNNHPGSIGFLSLTGNVPGVDESDSYALEAVDGVQPNAHNAAAGYYKYATQTFYYLAGTSGNAGSTAGSGNSTVAQLLVTRAQTTADLQTVLGGETVTKGSTQQFSVSTVGTNVGAYGLTGIPGVTNTSNTTEVNTLTGVPTALFANGGNTCTVNAGGNSN